MSKIVLITGSTDGIGKQTAFELAQLGYKIIIHGRDENKCIKTKDEIGSKIYNSELSYVVADLSSVEEIKKMSDELHSKFSRIDVLINNAGVFLRKRITNKEGIELTFMINHLAHFYLSYLIFDHLKKSEDARIINVSSIAHENADFDKDDFMLEKNYSGYKAYANSKLYNILFTYALVRRLRSKNITTYALHPGVISTKLLYEGFRISGSPLTVGAETPVYLATTEEIKIYNGQYFIKKKPVRSSKLSYDEALQEKLWDYSINLLKLNKDEVESVFSS